jgi:hypothetical protein
LAVAVSFCKCCAKIIIGDGGAASEGKRQPALALQEIRGFTSAFLIFHFSFLITQ